MKQRSLLHAHSTRTGEEILDTAFAFSATTRILFKLAIALALLIFFAGCTDADKPAETKPAPQGPELVTGRYAFQKVYIAARGWARDAQAYRIESSTTDEGNGHDGKWAIWRVGFASPSQRGVKGYMWSGSAAANAPSRGINPGTEDNYSPTNTSTQVFDIAFLKIDSDQAFAEAQKHGGQKVLEKSPDMPVMYVCDFNHNTNQLVWHVIYGASRDAAKLTIAVDASTGNFIRVEK